MGEREAILKRVEIRPLRDLGEHEGTLRLQRTIWGFDDSDLVAPRLFGVFTHIGGSCLGAFLDGALVGYALAFAAFKPSGKAYWHSHMTGLEPSAQNLGLGRLLKLRQREEALAVGLDLIEWTFDPLQARNAFFNIEKLGTAVEAYLPNLYGVTSSELHGSLPTDRLLAAWHLRSPGVESRAAGRTPALVRGVNRIEVPGRIAGVPRAAAVQIQARVREQFRTALQLGLRVTGFERTQAGGAYHLAP